MVVSGVGVACLGRRESVLNHGRVACVDPKNSLLIQTRLSALLSPSLRPMF